MFSSRTRIAAVFGFALMLVLIPVISFVIKSRIEAQNSLTQKYNQPVTNNVAQAVPDKLPSGSLALNNPSPTPDTTSDSAQVTYGPTLNFSVSLEGRPAANQGGKFFLGIAQGSVTTNPQYLLSFTINMPASGSYSGLSLVGLAQGMNYTAYIKGPAQLVKAVSFALTPTGATLNNGQPINLISGDLNEDNIVDAADLAIAKSLYGTTPSSPKWSPNADLNGDGIINNWDLAIITKNLGTTGDSGAWYSRIDASASSSAQISTPSNIGGESATFSPIPRSGGYWMWVPSAN